MIRFRNPGVQFSTQFQIMKVLYENLKNKQPFSLEDMANVIANEKLMTAYGYSGDVALKLSNTEKDSMNSTKMNVKMYAEVFKMLGWVTPSGKKSYPIEFTYIGEHIATAKNEPKKLYEQCVLGINNPNELSARVKYTEQVRFFKCVLQSFLDLDDIMYKHEFCIGPMSVDDICIEDYNKMIKDIRNLRGDNRRLKVAFEELAQSLGMKETAVDNCTRIPVALLKNCNFAEDYSTKELYPPVKKSCLKITDYGKEVLNQLNNMKDLRLSEFQNYNEETQMALIRLGIFHMLKRADYDITPVKEQIEADEERCKDILQGKELLFSPYQTIRHELIKEAIGIKSSKGEKKDSTKVLSESKKSYVIPSAKNIVEMWDLDVAISPNLSLLTSDKDIEFLNNVESLLTKGRNINEIVDYLFINYKILKQDNFYPLIATLFKIMGFNCKVSRAGDNGSRWDAIIEDENRSIPIEIKSPTEEEHISIKAIRQALENKIVLLSRKTHPTTIEATSLAIGYNLPNDRAEVGRLIQDFKNTYDYKIGVMDLKTLLTIAISILVEGIGFDKEKLYNLEGIVGANS